MIKDYAKILDLIQNIRQTIINNNLDYISHGIPMSEDAQEELKVLSDVENLIGDALYNKVETHTDGNFIIFTIDGKTYRIIASAPVTNEKEEVLEDMSEVEKALDSLEETEDTTETEEVEVTEKEPETVNHSVLSYHQVNFTITRNNLTPEDFTMIISPIETFEKEGNCKIIAFEQKTNQLLSSFVNEDEKTSLIVNLKDFEVLITGRYDESGKFITNVIPTGNSATLKDQIQINKTTVCEYIPAAPLSYMGKDGESLMYVYPSFDDDEFITIIKSNNFCDHYRLSPTNPVKITLNDDVVKEIVPEWQEDNLVINTFEK